LTCTNPVVASFCGQREYTLCWCWLNILIDRMQNIDCLCSVCNLGRCEDNSLKIVSVNLGYVSLVTNLMPYGTVSCILIFEPNYIVATEDSRNLHIWEMVDGWRYIFSVVSTLYVSLSISCFNTSLFKLQFYYVQSTIF